MQNDHPDSDYDDDNIDLMQLWQTLVDGKWLIALILIVCTGLATTAAFIMKPKYEGRLTASFADEGKGQGGLSALAGQFGGLADLAGVSLGGGGGGRDTNLAFLKSRAMIEAFIKENNLMPVLFADKWDASAKKWRTDDPDDTPTLGKAYKLFSERIFDVQHDKKTGLVTVVVTWKDREQAAHWANSLIKMANATLRERAINDAQLSLNYLKDELAKTSLIEIQNTIHRIAETQIKTMMMANTQEQFAFKVIDPAVVSDADAFVKPKRPMMIALGAVGGLFLGCLVVFARKAIRNRRQAALLPAASAA